MNKLNLAIIGQGRSGKDIHGKFLLSEENQYYRVAYVAEEDERRREISRERYKGCRVVADYRELLDKKDIDVVVNASYSHQHYGITKDLLKHGFNVVTEKPCARNRHECDDLIGIAKDNNVLFAVFQQTFFAPFYQDALRVARSGILGDILQINIRYNSFSRRWDWQTLQKMMGGNAYNTGPHPFGIALGLLDFPAETKVAFSRLACSEMSGGDYDDFCKVILCAPGKPLADIEINNTDAYTGYNVKLQGTRGCFKCTPTSFEYKYLAPGDNPPRVASDTFLQDDKGNPVYCNEKLVVRQETGAYQGTAFDVGTREFYRDLYLALTEGKEMYVPAEKVKDIIGIIETVHAQNPLPRKY